MIENLIVFYEAAGAYLLVYGLFIIAGLALLWYTFTRVSRVSLAKDMAKQRAALFDFVKKHPQRAKHLDYGIQKLLTVAKNYADFQQSLNTYEVMHMILSEPPHDSEIEKALRLCLADPDVVPIMFEMQRILTRTMLFASPVIVILSVLIVIPVILVAGVAKLFKASGSIIKRFGRYIGWQGFYYSSNTHHFA